MSVVSWRAVGSAGENGLCGHFIFFWGGGCVCVRPINCARWPPKEVGVCVVRLDCNVRCPLFGNILWWWRCGALKVGSVLG